MQGVSSFGRTTCGVGVGAGVGAGVDTGIGVGDGSTGLNTGFKFGFGAALTVTPLFHTSLVPDLMQVNFLPPAVAVVPAFVHFAPALTDANEGAPKRDMHSNRVIKTRDRVMR